MEQMLSKDQKEFQTITQLQKLHGIMQSIHAACEHYGKDEDGHIDYVRGANIAGFVKVADAMLAQGVV